MDNRLKSYLKKQDIDYKIHKHSAVFTVDESKKINISIPGLHCKTLFLKDNNSNYYLIGMEANKRLDIKKLRKHLDIKKLQFASPEELKKYLDLTPGSVSIFGMINAQEVMLILDKQVWFAEIVGFHPNINTSTLEISHHNLEKFYNSIKADKKIIEL